MQYKTKHKLSPAENKTTQEDTRGNPFFKLTLRPRTSYGQPLGLSFNCSTAICGSLVSEMRKQLATQIKRIIYSFS